MKKNISITLTLIIFSIIKLIAQPCNTGVAARSPMFGVPPGGISQATITAQSFTANCSGILSSITFTFDLSSDDFRSTGDFIKCNFKTASGVLLGKGVMPNGKDTTDKIFPTGSLTVNFSCIPIVSGTQYIWELEDVSNVSPPNQFVFLLSKRTATAPDYAGGNMILDGVPTATTDLQGWKVNIATGNPVLTAIQSQTNASCGVCADGTASVLASGGTGSYTYSWSPSGGTTAIASGLLPNTYTCTIKSCEQTITKTFTISGCSSISSSISSQTNIACNGANNGAVTILASGGSGFTYTWSPSGGNSATASGLSAGTYSCNITNSCGSIKTQTVLITQPTALTTASAVTNVLCNGASTGAATITASGGTAGYTYLWSTAATTSVITGQSAGVKTVTVTDASGCTANNTVTITQPASALTTATAVTNVLCNGNATGSATITATGGTTSYSYLWSTGATTSVIASQTAGTKSYTVTDANGCTSIGNATISQPASALATSTAVTNVSCNGGSTGSATITATGGTASYSYLWSTGATTSIITSQTSGVKTATVTDANGCTSIKSVTISQPASALATSTAVTNVACFGNSTGSATVTATGGTASYSYLWSTGATTSVITSQASGTKSYTVTDANGCTSSGNAIISQPLSALTTSTTVTNVLCNGGSTGSATITATGGTSAYSYLWSTGATTSVITSQTAGVKTATVTDANGCSSIKSVSITQPVTALATSTTVANVACFGNSTGSATITATGGTTSYSYLWSTGATTSVITSQASGTKSYTVTDANGCSSTGNAIISQPTSALVTATAVTNILCNGNATGSATIIATGGTAAYTYLWSTGATTSVIVSQTAGVKTATVTDANGCSSIKSVSISQPASALATSTAVTNVACFGNSTGSATITATGGTASYSYLWSTGATTSVITSQTAGVKTATVTDANGCTSIKSVSISQPTSALATSTAVTNVLCNGGATGSATITATGGTASYSYLWSTGATTSVISSQTAGIKTVTVTDANGCTSVNSVSILEPTLLTATTTQTNTTCNGVCDGSAIVTPNGGTAPYTFVWSPGGLTSASVNSLCAGSYTVAITDANVCSLTKTITITEPTAVTISALSGNILCNGGSTSVTVTANGGTGAYTGTGSFTQTAGTYTYVVTDANACSTNTVITITEPTALNISLSAAPIACNGSTTQVIFNMTGGTAPYSGNSPVTVSAGSYTYIVTDANNCTVSETITVNQPAAIVASQTITLCNGQSLSIGSNTYTSSGTYVDVLQAQVNGCDSTLTTELTILPAITHTQNVALCFGEVLSVASNIYNASGTYTDVLTASNGCDSTLTTVLVINPAIDVNTSLSGLTISANESSASYQWIDCDNSNQTIVGETNQSFTASSNGNYAVIVTQNNCSDTSACVNISTVGIKDASKSNTVNIYPNPSNGIYNMTGLIINSKITVYDAIGQIVYTSTTTESKETIDISNLPNGVYMIQLNSENGTTTKKIIKKN